MRALALFLSLYLAAAASAQDERHDRVYTSETYGLSATAPDEGWIFYPETNPSPKARLHLTVFPRGTPGVPSVSVYVSDADSAVDATAARELAAKTLETQGATDFERGVGKVAGREAPFFRAKMKNPLGGMLLVRCLERVEHGYVYSILCVRGLEDEASDAKLDAILASIEFPEPKKEVESAETTTWRGLAAKCADDLPWASSWDEASKVAKEKGKLVLVLFQNYAPLALPSTMRTGALMDPDFAALVGERFVVWMLATEGEAPFRDAKSFGMGKHSFGSAFLFVEPDGRVAAECGVSNASYLDEFARGVLAGRKAEAPLAGDALTRAQALFRRGDLGASEKLLAAMNSAEAHRLRAAIFRRERKGKEALEELHAAVRVAAKELEPELACDEAVLLMRMKRTDEAAAGFERVMKDWPDHPRASEAAFWLGAFDVLRLGVTLGVERWKKLVEAHAESPWARKAAANLLGQGCFVTGLERLEWPEADLVACAAKPARSPLGANETARAEREAVAWLVANQREDGSWWNPMDGFSVGANLYTPACSAICGSALLAHPDAKGSRAAAEKLLGYALALHRSGKLKAGEDLAGVYSIWNRTLVAWTLGRALRAGVGDAGELEAAMQELTDTVVASQDRRGGWPYVHLPGPSGDTGIDPSASFLTAGVALALLDLREAKANVPKDSIERALDFHPKLRDEDGTFRYFSEVPGALVSGVHPEACGRGPVCALALRRGGRGDDALLRRTLDLFLAHRGEFKAEWGKELCHTSPEGFGAHYLFYDYLFAAKAAHELPREDRQRYRGPLLADILGARLADGSFCDLPGLGRPYATAMAALALQELQP